MVQVRRIALLMGQDLGYCRGVLCGVHTYAEQTRRPWVFRDAQPHCEVLRPLREWKAHGIIAHLADRDFARKLIAMRIPLVNTTDTLAELDAPLVEVDNDRVGRLAAAHFLERGFQHFGYFGSAWTGFSKQREQGFRAALSEAGYAVHSCYAEYLPRPPTSASWKQVDHRVRDWLTQLAKPAAILASNDTPARDLAEICRQLGFLVPEEIALLGVDNDQLVCSLATPPLSSVVNPAEQIGFEAARLLDQIMTGQRPPRQPRFLPPTHVVTRQSTDIVAINDPDVSAAVALIHRQAMQTLRVSDIAREVGVARRGLERRFRKLLGRSPLDEIHRVRIERAKGLLVNTDLAIPAVARAAGFGSPQRLGAIFRQHTGVSPRIFRRESRRPGGLS